MMRYGCPDSKIARTTCHRTRRPIRIDGRADEDAWRRAPKSPRFVDMVTGDPGLYDTRAAALWDDEALYVAFWIEEPFPEARLAKRDSLVFFESDVEVFIDGGDAYYEFEINARGTVYEAFYIWRDAYRRGGRFDLPEFDAVDKGITFGGDYERTADNFWTGNHPRGLRWAFLDWDFTGLQSAVRVDGKLNDRTRVSRGWTVELAFPWSGMKHLANGRSLPPKNGDVWRIFFGRFEKMSVDGREVQPHPAWVWSPHGVRDTHLPESFPYVRFSSRCVQDL
ncbi:MAG TPA: carbohydrate-binding family 9-like protein [Planctomycetota bacterium]|nr:carbohydrate-binding family 9-like protein [Planctomycetota bacterium]